MKSDRQSFTSTCNKVLGKKMQHHKEWNTAETLKKTEERKRKMLKSYRNRKSLGL